MTGLSFAASADFSIVLTDVDLANEALPSFGRSFVAPASDGFWLCIVEEIMNQVHSENQHLKRIIEPNVAEKMT